MEGQGPRGRPRASPGGTTPQGLAHRRRSQEEAMMPWELTPVPSPIIGQLEYPCARILMTNQDRLHRSKKTPRTRQIKIHSKKNLTNHTGLGKKWGNGTLTRRNTRLFNLEESLSKCHLRQLTIQAGREGKICKWRL